MRDKQDFDAALRDVKSGDGKREMDRIRGMVTEIVAEQDEFISAQNLRGAQQARQTIWTIGIGSVCGFLFVAASCLLIHNDLARRRQAAERIETQAAALLRAHNDLELRVLERTSELSQAGELMRMSEALASSHSIRVCNFDGIVIADSESYYIDANRSMCRMLGYTRDELIGLHASDIVAQSEVPHIGAALGVIKANSRYEREWQFRRKDGSIVAAEVIATLMPDGNLMGMIRDITERKQNEVALRKNEAQLQTIVENVNEAVVSSDLNGNLLHFNLPCPWIPWDMPMPMKVAAPR